MNRESSCIYVTVCPTCRAGKGEACRRLWPLGKKPPVLHKRRVGKFLKERGMR